MNTMNKSNAALIPYRLISLLFWLILAWYLTCVPIAVSQLVVSQPEDEPIPPPLDVEDLSKTIAVNLNFENGSVSGYTAEVVFGHAPGSLGNPPLLRIDLFDFRGNLIEQFNAWHPLLTFVTDDTGSERLILETEATGAIAFPFFAEYGTMRVVDVEQDREIFSVDLIPTIRNFCEAHLDDPECGNIADFHR